ncbi:MAG: Veg family protein [Bacilli bacterium]|nr:Veg family protein [Bacilli bacterium]MDD4282410.1 Veg family protein [Bacilli bacterium]MDD4718444.1 Veg family protein [Bacilli bacterium]
MSVTLGNGMYITIDDVKAKLSKHVGNKVTINYNLGRNKFEQYDAIIKEMYNYVFIVELDNEIKSFSYSDVITKTIKIEY